MEKHLLHHFTLCGSGTPRGVYVSVGEIPTRQLTIRAVVKGIVIFRESA